MKNTIMKLVLAVMVVFAGVMGVSAQQTANEGYLGYSFLRQDVKFERPAFRFNENTDSHGVTASYTRYLNGSPKKVGTVGITGEVAANFDSNEASLVTVLGGIRAKARNMKYVQPSLKLVGGVARQHVNRRNITDTSDVSAAFAAGVGLDFVLKEGTRYKPFVGVDYLNTGFHGERQSGVRFNAGLVF